MILAIPVVFVLLRRFQSAVVSQETRLKQEVLSLESVQVFRKQRMESPVVLLEFFRE